MGKLFISSDKGSLTCGTAVYFHSLLISRPVRNTEDKTRPPLRIFIFNTPLSPRKLGPITRLLLCRGRALQSWLSFSFSFPLRATLKKKRKRKRRGKKFHCFVLPILSLLPFYFITFFLSLFSLFYHPLRSLSSRVFPLARNIALSDTGCSFKATSSFSGNVVLELMENFLFCFFFFFFPSSFFRARVSREISRVINCWKFSGGYFRHPDISQIYAQSKEEE